mmetsp:Transcript_14254/g.40398  ORF Transcript_14254/g.40398 Transcript_14254/m.40398 type:complete len:253 (-) Transcript_14254:183-941(-)|eukprot:CAMPEP_0117684216 /NCGR_PEP_ID=MMETSP0804-20121206/20946_1 /TAXON_ID=1074897 /ORGANISM="Tetraselmis astigmatica, Strain CCMP880" /LENGTH=252 /DNA_ID=CAMNT_0005495123 /DNA_START=138 /DNA_END=896 /DNA_ORIENTATION=-
MGVCLGIDPITESLSRLARELAQSESPESDPPQEAVTGKDSVEIELARLDAALAAHDVEMSEFWGSFQPERPSIGHSSDSQEQVPAVTEDRRKRCTTEAASFSSSWQERAFPGLAERRWLQLLVDESVSIYADPVTLRQFLPVYDKAQRVTGEFVEIDADHPNYIEAQDLQEAIQEHRAATKLTTTAEGSVKSEANTCGSSLSSPSAQSSGEMFPSEVESSWKKSGDNKNTLGVRKGGVQKIRRPVSRTLDL